MKAQFSLSPMIAGLPADSIASWSLGQMAGSMRALSQSLISSYFAPAAEGIEAILTPHAAEGKVAPLRQRAPKVNP
jgi:hypothetical protein